MVVLLASNYNTTAFVETLKSSVQFKLVFFIKKLAPDCSISVEKVFDDGFSVILRVSIVNEFNAFPSLIDVFVFAGSVQILKFILLLFTEIESVFKPEEHIKLFAIVVFVESIVNGVVRFGTLSLH